VAPKPVNQALRIFSTSSSSWRNCLTTC